MFGTEHRARRYFTGLVNASGSSMVQKTLETSDSGGAPLITEARTLAIRRAKTRRSRKARTLALRCTAGLRRQFGFQAKAETTDATSQTDISLPQRVDIIWQSHVVGPSAHVDSRPAAEESDCESADQGDDIFESAYAFAALDYQSRSQDF